MMKLISKKQVINQNIINLKYEIMKTITLKVEIEVEDDYVLDDENWLLENAVNGEYEYSVTKNIN